MPNLVASFRRLPRDVQLYAWASFLIGIGSFGIWAVLFNLYLQRLGKLCIALPDRTELRAFVQPARFFLTAVLSPSDAQNAARCQ